MVPGHIQRGGSPNAYDRVLSTQFGVHAAELIRDGVFGVTVALKGNEITHNNLADIAGVPKLVPEDDQMVKTANLLSQEGLNVIGLPKTIDNDLYGTDFTFGFHTALDIATDVIDRIHTTAASHGRCMVIEIMGNKAGWLTLYSGVAGGADAILIPEIPYDIKKVAKVVEARAKSNKGFTILAVAEGAMDKEEAKMKKKEREAKRAAEHFSASAYVAQQLR